MKTVDYFKINHPKYRLQKKLDEIRHTIISGTQELYNYLHTNNQLNQLPFTHYLSSDEPSGYVIWQVNFSQDPMGAEWYGMHNMLGKDKGLICVTNR